MPDATLRLGGYQAETSILTRSLRRLATALADIPDANWHVEVMRDVTERGARAVDLLSMVEKGSVNICYFASSYLVGRVAALGCFDTPFAVVDRARIYADLDGDAGRASRRRRGPPHRLSRGGLLGQRVAPHLQPVAPDPAARRLPRHAHPHARQRHLSAGACGHGLHRR